METLCGVLGIETKREEEILDADIEKLIEERQRARKERILHVPMKSEINCLLRELY